MIKKIYCLLIFCSTSIFGQQYNDSVALKSQNDIYYNSNATHKSADEYLSMNLFPSPSTLKYLKTRITLSIEINNILEYQNIINELDNFSGWTVTCCDDSVRIILTSGLILYPFTEPPNAPPFFLAKLLFGKPCEAVDNRYEYLKFMNYVEDYGWPNEMVDQLKWTTVYKNDEDEKCYYIDFDAREDSTGRMRVYNRNIRCIDTRIIKEPESNYMIPFESE